MFMVPSLRYVGCGWRSYYKWQSSSSQAAAGSVFSEAQVGLSANSAHGRYMELPQAQAEHGK